ncbi:ArsR family transcriptional regulator [Haladaptatus salinisoli]|uniref:ArsR family transcriptional regulator n=1 Tax=Haladaptatus salinisoli TaxID=2884876 RepID=UPI001D0A8D23|nr:ArsR family transcriptional regulator [Haladaptatus salinisoli]
MDWTERLPPRPWIVRGVVLLLVVALLAPSAVSAITYDQEESNLQRGTIESPANGTTVISVQGFHFQGKGNKKKPARLVAVGPKGNVEWVHNGSKEGATWFYDVDPLPNGNLFVVSTQRGGTLVYEYNPETKEKVWKQFLEIHDTHDVDLINNGTQLLVANMRAYNETTGQNDDSIYVYDLEKDKIVWRWYFRNYYEKSAGMDEYTGDWTHVNDVDKIGPGKYMADPRNMDEVLVIDRETKNVTVKLGEDGSNHDILYEQHNPDYLESESGNPTILVADSHNHRVVEYAKRGGSWEKTWQMGSSEKFTWPRDADRLPNGNTLIVDSSNHRVLEVTPKGKIVWEFYSPWLPYDAERIAHGGGSNGPTMADLGVTGEYQVHGSANIDPGTGDSVKMSVLLADAFSGTSFEDEMRQYGEQWDQVTPFIRPIWMSEYAFIAALFAILLVLGLAVGELVYQRKRIYYGVRRLA